MNNVTDINGQDKQPDLLVEGFHRLDDHLLDNRAPKITFLPGFYKKEDAVKIEYLKKLASTMNHAAKLISEERDRMGTMLVAKDKQLKIALEQLAGANAMVQSEVTRMNAKKQEYTKNIAELSARVRELERGNND